MSDVALWAMPVCAGIACFWLATANGVRSIELAGRLPGVQVLAARRILVGSKSLHINICATSSLAEGREFNLGLVRTGGELEDLQVRVSLPMWSTQHVARVARFIVEFDRKQLSEPFSASSLERFLSLRSAWRVPVTAACQVGSLLLACVPLEAEQPLSERGSFVWDGNDLRYVKPQKLVFGSVTIFVWRDAVFNTAYVEHETRLLEVDLKAQTKGSTSSVVSALAEAPEINFERVLRLFRAAGSPAERVELDNILRQILIHRLRSSPQRSAQLAALRADGRIFFVVEGMRDESCEPSAAQIDPDGPASPLQLVFDEPSLHGLKTQVFEANKDFEVGSNSFCALIEGESSEPTRHWVPITDIRSSTAYRIITRLPRLNRSSDHLLATLYAPARRAHGERMRRIELGLRNCSRYQEADPDVIVMIRAADDGFALERSLISIGSTQGAHRLCVIAVPMAPRMADTIEKCVSRYAAFYGFSASVAIYHESHDLGSVVLSVAARARGPIILLESGVIFRDPSWLPTILNHVGAVRPFLSEEKQAVTTGTLASPKSTSWACYRTDPHEERCSIIAWAGAGFRNGLPVGLRTVYGLARALSLTHEGPVLPPSANLSDLATETSKLVSERYEERLDEFVAGPISHEFGEKIEDRPAKRVATR